MKGIIFDIKRFAVHDGPGIRTTVFMKGCPLSCWWCHNPESIDPKSTCVSKTVQLNGKTFTDSELVGYEITVDHLMEEIEKERVFMEESGGGVTFSGGEPLMQHKFLFELLKRCKTVGIHTTVDTSAFSSWENLNEVAEYTDLFLIDLKLMDNDSHQKYTGVSNTIILENIQKLIEIKSKVRIRVPVIPSITDTPQNIDETMAFISEMKEEIFGIDLLPYHKIATQKYKRFGLENRMGSIAKPNKEHLSTLKKQFEKAGFTTKIGG